LRFHRLLDLEGENLLDSDGLKGLADAFLSKKIVEGRKAVGRARFLRRHGRLLCEFPFSFTRQLQVRRRRLPGLLDYSVERHQTALREAKEDSRNPVAGQIATHLPQTVAQGAAERHTHGLPELRAHEVLTDDHAISLR
jgi:hypothetical protein